MHFASIPPRNHSAAADGLDGSHPDRDPLSHGKPAAFSAGLTQSPPGEKRELPSTPPKPTYEELRALVQQYDAPPPPRRPIARTGVIALIFVIGSVLGVGLSSFIDEMPLQSWQPSFLSGQSFRFGSNGTSESELPYDGRPDHVATQAQPVRPLAGAGELPYDGAENTDNALAHHSAPEPAAKMQADPVLQLSRSGELPQPTGNPRQSAVSNGVAAADRNAATPKRQPTIRSQKDREIDRIRKQAAEELKKKNGPGADSARKGGPDSAPQKLGRKGGTHKAGLPAMAAMLEQCEQAGNFILREQCKWQLCGGKWGKSGCPSYPQRATSLN